MQESAAPDEGKEGAVFHRTLDHLPAHLSLCSQLRPLPPCQGPQGGTGVCLLWLLTVTWIVPSIQRGI